MEQIRKRISRHGKEKDRSNPKIKATRMVSEVGSLLGRAGTVGLGKAVEVLDTLGSSMTNLNINSGFVSGVTSKGSKIYILAFEVANTIVKGANLKISVSEENIKFLKEEILNSEGVRQLVSNDMDDLLRIAAADKRKELKIFAGEVVRFGNHCKDPQWHQLDRIFEKLGTELHVHKQTKEEAEAAMQYLMTLAQHTAELYHELHALDRFDQDYRRKLHEEESLNASQRGDSLVILRSELKSQQKHVKNLKKKSLWSKSLEEVMEKLVDIVYFLHQEIQDNFKDADFENEKFVSKKNPRISCQQLGPAGLALHYANIVNQIDSLVSRPSSVPPNTRDTLYRGLPPSMKTALRSKLQSDSLKEEVVIDNAAAYVSAGRMIEDEYPTIAWTPCAAHVLDLILEDIGKTAWVKSIVEKAKNITKFIYNHSWVLHLMRTDFTEGRDLIRPGITRFATSFLSLQSVHNKRAALKQMFVCNKWMESRYAREPDGMNVVNVIFDDNYWIAASQIIKITEPLVKVLHVVDLDKASMGYLYEVMDRAKETIQSFYIYDAARFRHIWDMIDRRWNGQLHRPLHAAGLYLNPKFFYADTFDPSNGEINQGLHRAIKCLVPDVNTRRIILNKEIQDYKKAQGYLFSSPECVDARTCLAPDLWWEDYGGSTPNLQKVAIKILSQVCSSAGCERNWSTFEHIHSKKRSRLTQERLNDLVFVHYNLRLRHRLIEGTSNEAIELDEIDATEPWSSWLRDVPEEVQDFDFTSQDVDRLEEEAIAMAEEEERAREEVQRAREEGVDAT